MAVEVDDLLAPQGPVEVTLFPGEGAPSTALNDRLQTYIDRAVAKVGETGVSDPDPAVLAWSLHLTFTAAYIIASARPANENSMVAVLGSQGFAKDQRDTLKDLASEYAHKYEEAVSAALLPQPQPRGFQSREISNSFEW